MLNYQEVDEIQLEDLEAAVEMFDKLGLASARETDKTKQEDKL